VRISEHVYALKVPFHISLGPEVRLDRFVYVYFIVGSRVHMVDSGVLAAQPLISEFIGGLGHAVEDVGHLLLTHAHPDHIGTARWLKEVSGCSVGIHAAEKEWIEDVDAQFRVRPVPGFHQLVGGSVVPDILFKDGQVISLEPGLTLDVFHTPGHSKGSVSFYLREDNVLVSGDLLPVPGDLPVYENVGVLRSSIERLRRLDQAKVLLSSWAEPSFYPQIAGTFDAALAWLDRIDQEVCKNAGLIGSDPMAGCRAVLERLGLPSGLASPFLLVSLKAHF